MAARATSTSKVPVYLLLGSTLALLLFGLVFIYSASSVTAYVGKGNSAYYLFKQLTFIGVGLVAFLALSQWKPSGDRVLTPERVAWFIWSISVVGLIAVLMFGVGKYGAQRWLSIGGQSIQPSEYAKLGCVLVAASLLSRFAKGEIDSKAVTVQMSAAMLCVFLLVMKQPDMGTTVLIAAAVFFVMMLGGVSGRILGSLIGGGAAIAGVFIIFEGYRMNRVTGFLDPWADPLGKGYQIIQAKYAFGSGGFGGVGLGLSKQKFEYLPMAHTDFIFAIIGEELGLLGTLAVVAAFGVFLYAGIRIALDSKDTFGRLMAGGLTLMIVMQAIVNMASVTGLIPVIGVPLPLVSYGGSSLTFTLGCIGLIASVAWHGNKAQAVRLKDVSKSKGSSGANSDEWRRNRRSHLSGVDGGRAAAARRA